MTDKPSANCDKNAFEGSYPSSPSGAVVRITFRVSDAVRRQKVVDARTRGPRSVCYGDFDFARRCTLIGAAHMRTDLRADRPLLDWRCGCSNADGPILAGMSPFCAWTTQGPPFPGAKSLRGRSGTSRAGSRRWSPGCADEGWLCARLIPTREELDDDHAPAAAWARRSGIWRFDRCIVLGRR